MFKGRGKDGHGKMYSNLLPCRILEFSPGLHHEGQVPKDYVEILLQTVPRGGTKKWSGNSCKMEEMDPRKLVQVVCADTSLSGS